LDVAVKFYRDILGFREFSRPKGLASEERTLNLRVPDGDDYLELIPSAPAQASVSSSGTVESGTAQESSNSRDHFCLAVPDVERSLAALQVRGKGNALLRLVDVEVRRNEDDKVLLLDPGETQVELKKDKRIQSR
jgi:lactoylglutathione lyase